MHLSFVTPAFGRHEVFRRALEQRVSAMAALAESGITSDGVVVADDENLEIAQEFGFDTIELPNILGDRINAGFAWAREADYVCFCGADNWLHIDYLKGIQPWGGRKKPPAITGHGIAVVNLETDRMQTLYVYGNSGVPPWILPRWALERADWSPVMAQPAGMELRIYMALGLNKSDWVFHDPSPFCRVDFKGPGSMTDYRTLVHLRHGPELEDAQAILEEQYGLVPA